MSTTKWPTLTLLKRDRDGAEQCLMCPLRDGEPTYHLATARTKSHRLLSNLIAGGLLHERWYYLTDSQRRTVTDWVARNGLGSELFGAWLRAADRPYRKRGGLVFPEAPRTLDPETDV